MKQINIPYSEYLILLDYRANIETFYDESECINGRIIQSGFICPHCNSNDPSEKCNGKSYGDLEKEFITK